MSGANGGADAGTDGGGPNTRLVTICNQRGLHARAAAKFVNCASRFNAEISVRREETSVSGQSIMGLMMLAAGPGSEIEISAKGAEAEGALAALCALVEAGFDEG